jgi:osmotically inducible lipoprotein OsmB
MSQIKLIAASICFLTLIGCSNNPHDNRVLWGSGIGAVGGGLIGNAIGGNAASTAIGAAAGGVAGAAISSETSPYRNRRY